MADFSTWSTQQFEQRLVFKHYGEPVITVHFRVPLKDRAPFATATGWVASVHTKPFVAVEPKYTVTLVTPGHPQGSSKHYARTEEQVVALIVGHLRYHQDLYE